MKRDGRGNPGRIVLKNVPRLRLVDVLRRRRTTLKALVAELGLTTYSGLEIWCGRMGIVAPPEADFNLIFPPAPAARVNSPREGVIVLEAPPVIAEATGRELPEPPSEGACEPSEPSQKKRRARKDGQPSDE